MPKQQQQAFPSLAEAAAAGNGGGGGSWANRMKTGASGGKAGWSTAPSGPREGAAWAAQCGDQSVSTATATPTGSNGSGAAAGGGAAPVDMRAAIAAADAKGRTYSQMTLEELYNERLLQAPPPPGSFSRNAQTFNLDESVKGKRMNTLSGLALFKEVLSPAEQQLTLHYVRRLRDLGDDGALCGRTYSAPRRWMKGKGRVTVQLGCCYNYARDSQGNPPGILPKEPVCGMGRFLEDLIDRMCQRGIFTQVTRPDTCIINFYSEGDCIPPHIDHLDFTRPFVTLSLLSEQSILFGANIKIVDEGEFAAPFNCPLPVGSVLVLDGNGANVAKHCVPSVRSDRVSITFRRIGHKDWKKGFGVNMSAFEGPHGTLPSNAKQGPIR